MLQRQTNSHLLAFLILSQAVTYGKIYILVVISKAMHCRMVNLNGYLMMSPYIPP